MKKRVLWLFVCMALFACSKAPGAKDTGYQGIAWGANAQTVAGKLGVAPRLRSTDALFASYNRADAPRLGALMEKGFAKLLVGKGGANLGSLHALKGMAMLDQGKAGYSLFFDGKFGMHVRPIPASGFEVEHKRLMKRYGVIDRKVDFIPNASDSSYFIMWHDADGKILLARTVYREGAQHKVTVCQVIHMDKRLYDAITSEL